MTTPAITKFTSLGNIFVQTYERYLPSAFDESLSLLQKVNKVISYLNQNSQLMDSVLDQWNEIYDWVTTDGLNDAVAVQLNLLLSTGELGALIANKLSGHYNVKEYGVKGDGVTNDSDAFQTMINQIRSDALLNSLNVMPTIEVPSGLYILDKQIVMSPYIKFKALGLVGFRITFNGSAFWIKPDPSDPIYTSTTVNQDKARNAWNRGRYFDGNFVFTTNLDRATTGNATVALEIGDTNIGSNKALPVSRYEISQVNVYGLAKAIKLNTVNNYLGTFINCHWEMNNTAVWFLTPTEGTQYNSGENMRFENCIIAGCTQPSFLLESPGVDIVISGTSFDFNASPLIHSKASGTSVRLQHCYVEKIGDGTGDQLLYKSAAQNLGDSWGRSSIYIDNLIMYLKRPAKMFQNEPNGTGNFIKVFLDINGIELRYDEGRPYDLPNRYLVPTTEKFNVLRRRISQVTTTVKNHVTADGNLLANGDFSKTPLNTVLSMTNLAADPYWKCTYHDSTVGPKIVAEGNGGSQCLRYDIVRTDNTLKLEYGYKLNCQPNDTLEMSALIKLAKLSSRTNVVYRYEFYDANDTLVSTQDYTDYGTDSPTITDVDGTNFRLLRTVGVVYVPGTAVKVKPIFIIGNVESTYVCIDDIYFTIVR